MSERITLLCGEVVQCMLHTASFWFLFFWLSLFMKTIFREGRGWKTECFVDGFEPHRVPDRSCVCNLDSNKNKIRNHRNECLLVFFFFFIINYQDVFLIRKILLYHQVTVICTQSNKINNRKPKRNWQNHSNGKTSHFQMRVETSTK